MNRFKNLSVFIKINVITVIAMFALIVVLILNASAISENNKSLELNRFQKTLYTIAGKSRKEFPLDRYPPPQICALPQTPCASDLLPPPLPHSQISPHDNHSPSNLFPRLSPAFKFAPPRTPRPPV